MAATKQEKELAVQTMIDAMRDLAEVESYTRQVIGNIHLSTQLQAQNPDHGIYNQVMHGKIQKVVASFQATILFVQKNQTNFDQEQKVLALKGEVKIIRDMAQQVELKMQSYKPADGGDSLLSGMQQILRLLKEFCPSFVKYVENPSL